MGLKRIELPTTRLLVFLSFNRHTCKRVVYIHIEKFIYQFVLYKIQINNNLFHIKYESQRNYSQLEGI